MSIFATLGKTEFKLLRAPTSFAIRYAMTYTEHGLIGQKDQLQRTGAKPDEINWGGQFNAGFCNPTAEFAKLKGHMDAFETLPLVLGNGDYLGSFVITTLDLVYQEATADGTVTGLEFTMALRESIGDATKPNAPGVLRSGLSLTIEGTPSTILNPLLPVSSNSIVEIPALETPNNLLDTVSQALAVADQVGQAAARINDIAAVAASGDVLGAVGLAGAYAPQLTEMAGQLPIDEFQNLTALAPFVTDAGEVAGNLRNTQELLLSAGGLLQNASTLSGISSASSTVQQAITVAGQMGPALNRIEAYGKTGSRLAGVAK